MVCLDLLHEARARNDNGDFQVNASCHDEALSHLYHQSMKRSLMLRCWGLARSNLDDEQRRKRNLPGQRVHLVQLKVSVPLLLLLAEH